MFESEISTALPILEPLMFLILGIAVYGILVVKFCKFLAKRDMFSLDLEKHNKDHHPMLMKALDLLIYVFNYLLIFPIITFASFVVMAAILVLLSKTASVEYIFLVSMAVIGSVRVASYFHELAAEELAKVLPLTLLVLLLADLSTFSASKAINALMSLPSYYVLLAYYLGFAIALEFMMKILRSIVKTVFHGNKA